MIAFLCSRLFRTSCSCCESYVYVYLCRSNLQQTRYALAALLVLASQVISGYPVVVRFSKVNKVLLNLLSQKLFLHWMLLGGKSYITRSIWHAQWEIAALVDWYCNDLFVFFMSQDLIALAKTRFTTKITSEFPANQNTADWSRSYKVLRRLFVFLAPSGIWEMRYDPW